MDGLISHLTSNLAFNRYSFRRCGRDDLEIIDVDKEVLGRKYVEHLSRYQESRISFPFNELIRRNNGIDTFILSGTIRLRDGGEDGPLPNVETNLLSTPLTEGLERLAEETGDSSFKDHNEDNHSRVIS